MPRIAYSDPFLLEIIWKDVIFVKAFLHLDDLPRNQLSFAMSKYPNSKNKIEEVAKNRVQSEQRLKSALAPGQNVGAWHIRPFARPSLRPIDSAAVASSLPLPRGAGGVGEGETGERGRRQSMGTGKPRAATDRTDAADAERTGAKKECKVN